MTHLQSCEAVCTDNRKVEGTIKCISGRLVDASHCVTDTGFITETVTKVVGSLDLELSAAASVASLTLAIAGAVGVDQQYVFVSFRTVLGSSGRLLSAATSASLRSLAATVSVDYEVAVPASCSPFECSASDVVAAALALSQPESDAERAFSESMLGSGVVVVSVSQINEPVTIESVVVRDEKGAVVKPIQTALVYDATTRESTSIDLGAVIGGVVAGLALLVLVGGLIHYFRLRQKVESSDDDAISSLSV